MTIHLGIENVPGLIVARVGPVVQIVRMTICTIHAPGGVTLDSSIKSRILRRHLIYA